MEELVERVLSLKAKGEGLKQASGSVAKEHGVSSSELYALALKHL